MAPLQSKKHPINYFGVLSIAILIFIGACISAIYIGLNIPKQGFYPIYILIIVLFCLLNLYTAWKFISVFKKNIPNYIFDNNYIQIEDLKYSYNDVDSLKLSGLFPFNLLGENLAPGLSVRFKDGKQFYLFDGYYKNTEDLKLHLEYKIYNSTPSNAQHFSKLTIHKF